jgi:hypothetical protein
MAAALTLEQGLQTQLAQCQLLLAEATAHADEPGLSPQAAWAYAIISVLLVVFAGCMAGLTLGLLSLDK